ncbi:NAD(P)-binding protein [Ramaria rubella]|nr:NAD(P)-binding protein [Ramaria rubella]
MRVLVTGASGVLGSAVYSAFKTSAAGHDILGTAHSRAQSHPELRALNLLDEGAVESLVKEFSPKWVIHCAAERRPDVAERDPEGAKKLNVGVTAHLGQLAWRYSFKLVYISTDYVFDGTNPPYATTATPNPLQLYGESKRAGEIALEQVDLAQSLILRVPVLYGPAPKNSDSAVNILLDVVQDQSGKTYKMDHYATRYPTNVLDIAAFLVRLAALTRPLPRILHYSAAEPFTKYEICLIFALILGVPHAHIIPDAEPPTGAGATTRPRDCHLDCTETEALGIEGGMGLTGFEEWWMARLKTDG